MIYTTNMIESLNARFRQATRRRGHFIWDGRVQADGISPYRYVPAAPELGHLRDDFLWPQHSAWCVPTTESQGEPNVTPGCSLINRPTVPTIYPPVAEARFLAIQAVSPPGAREGPIQLAAAFAVLAVAVLLMIVLPKTGADARQAALWAWCPLVALEAGNNAHLDVFSTLLTVAALLIAGRARTWKVTAAGAALLGLAIATKITPALAGPSIAGTGPNPPRRSLRSVMNLPQLGHQQRRTAAWVLVCDQAQ